MSIGQSWVDHRLSAECDLARELDEAREAREEAIGRKRWLRAVHAAGNREVERLQETQQKLVAVLRDACEVLKAHEPAPKPVLARCLAAIDDVERGR